ncbi:MAG: NAD-dependent epimerase/dehydratase family protein [Actinomycetota bacterium]|jgi:nucleoside-diphosphate-sugar epimerase|nr:NAD-dependent epimerase/dehydratase family protein [Actinomycetota bacterium]
MRVVVVGATGNVGVQTVTALADDGVEVVGVARRRPDLSLRGVTWEAADVAEDDLVPLLRGADAVVHLAWLLQPSRDEATQWRANVEGTRRVLDAVAEAGVGAVIVVSSIGAYSPGPKDTPVDESWPTDGVPTSPYSRQKAYNERVMDAFEARHPDIRVVRFRPGLLFQAAAASEIRRLFTGPFLPTSLLRRVGVPVVPDVPGLRLQLLHTSDAAEAIRLAVRLDVRGAFNLASDPPLDPPDIARVLGARLVAVPPRVLRAATGIGWWLRLLPIDPGWIDMALSAPLLSTERARRELGWQPRLGAEEVLADFVRALGEQRGAPTPTLARDAGGPARSREIATGIGGEAR